jgi:hypothetical protein
MYRFIIIFLFLFTTPLLFAESEHNNLIETHFGFFTPDIDKESGLNKKPYEDIFNKDGLRFGVAYSIEMVSHKYLGTFSILSGVEYFMVSGYGKYENNPIEKSHDETKLTMIPFELSLVYNLDQLQYLLDIPFVFYAKIGLNYNFWWITNGLGDTVDYEDGHSYGGKKGWNYGLGIRFLLDILDSDTAINFDNQYGVNGSYIFVEYNSSKIDDFGKDGLKLGGSYLKFGLALLF